MARTERNNSVILASEPVPDDFGQSAESILNWSPGQSEGRTWTNDHDPLTITPRDNFERSVNLPPMFWEGGRVLGENPRGHGGNM